MPTSDGQCHPHRSLSLLSRLVLPAPADTDLKKDLLNLTQNEFADLIDIAASNHVIVRGLEAYFERVSTDDDPIRADWARSSLHAEHTRIAKAVTYLEEVCGVLEQNECKAVVIKSLDHWPDLGSDLDLFTNSPSERVIELMQSRFDARIAQRSWGDRLAGKWNFILPGLPEAIEIHVDRLGQTGEQATIAESLLDHARLIRVGGGSFRATAVHDRLMISTLQRMYRHFYFRLCDVVDTAALDDAGSINYELLRASAAAAGIWEGVATYLAIVSDYAQCYRGRGLTLPLFVRESARFGGEQVYFARSFLRVPIVPQSARLYGSQLAGVLGRGELRNGARLSLLPWLATAAVIGQKLTGSDKGIW